ncbi:Mucin-associated surface protein (MASP) [Trypanosoma cruzi]|uniref:Mucin-associated surface protein (MASP), putative n=2 Tax=Trypanosoma cruzi TaxID=5693 RepID=Q4CXD7_TRYCC|nr:mucin-associated surface protein (MASP), putative [Trypanosoma cruzi]EAN84940.1 mucin-associated surface protein (MASP), putative [Trypanosoma cruzi]PWU87041.1 Mucin-associated surface protein (MASP) [Trypanosoma cruzi]|eukprot:XP_806791.1 mucin-associated surface protein (MASP) [Trypanosoma cruzi strain CL Brener]
MAMMMAGRVLLVCALCVLWCGACGGYAWDFNDTLNKYYYGANGTYCRLNSNFSFCNKKGDPSKGEEAASHKSNAQSGTGSDQSNADGSSGGQGRGSEGNDFRGPGGDSGTKELKNSVGGETTPTQQSPSATQPSTVSEDLPKPAAPGGPEAPGTTTELQPPPQSPLPAGGTPTPTTATPTADGSSGGRDNSSEKNGSDESEETDEGPQESQPPNANVTETPTPATVTAAQTSATRTPDESDGSTAASHTTSPLLLFLVACAAAAAVVAA